jgi:hypothetical protein
MSDKARTIIVIITCLSCMVYALLKLYNRPIKQVNTVKQEMYLLQITHVKASGQYLLQYSIDGTVQQCWMDNEQDCLNYIAYLCNKFNVVNYADINVPLVNNSPTE